MTGEEWGNVARYAVVALGVALMVYVLVKGGKRK